MHLASQAMACILQVRDAEARPCCSILTVLINNVFKETARTVQIIQRTGARHKGGEHRPGLQVFLGEILAERG